MAFNSLQSDFLEAMRNYTSTVAVLSAEHNGVKQAMTATSVASLSLDPPSMIISVNQEASIYNILGKGRNFCVNVLSSKQVALAEVCSKNEEESRFEVGSWSAFNNIPYNSDSLINIFCRCFDISEQTTHTVFFGEVIKIINSKGSTPLLYREGRYIE